MDVIEKIVSADWKQYNGVAYYSSDKVVDSLSQLCNLTAEEDNEKIYNFVLSSIGNNHGGTYYPAILSALTIIIEIARQGKSEVSRNCAIEILSDLYYCFEPEIENYSKISRQDLETFVRKNIESFVQENILQSESGRNKKLLKELAEYIHVNKS